MKILKRLWMWLYGKRYEIHYNGKQYIPPIDDNDKRMIKKSWGFYPQIVKVIEKHSLLKGEDLVTIYYKIKRV